MDEIQYAQTVAAQQEWEERQRDKFEEARRTMQEERLKQDREALLRYIGFDRAMKDVK